MKKIFYVAATAAMLASCSTDFDLSEVFGSGGTSETIGFQVQKGNNVTRATSLQKAGHYNFGVFGYKESDKTHAVMSDYLVGYLDNNLGYQQSGTTTGDQPGVEDGKSYWMYEGLGKDEYFGTYAGQTLTRFYQSNNPKQYLKYWDKSAEYTCFYAYAPYVGTESADERVTYVDGTAVDDTGDEYVLKIPNGSLVAGNDDPTKYEFMYAAKKVSAADYGHDVSLDFKRLVAKVNIKFWEDIPGYKVRIIDLKQGKYKGVQATPAIYKDSDSPASGPYGSYGYRYGTYYKTNGVKIKFDQDNNLDADIKQYDGARVDKDNKASLIFATPTVQEIGEARAFASASATDYYAIPKGNGAKVLEDNSKFEDVGIDENPDLAKTGFTFHVSYELTAEDTNERIVVQNATVHVPYNYCNWEANTHYTYIFKITKNSNGSTDTEPTIDPNDPDVPTVQTLYPIVFDNCTVQDWNEENESDWTITDGTNLSYHNIKLSKYSVDNTSTGDNRKISVTIENNDKHNNANTTIDYGKYGREENSVTVNTGIKVTNSAGQVVDWYSYSNSESTGTITVPTDAEEGVYTVTYYCPDSDIDRNHPKTWTAKFYVGQEYTITTDHLYVGTGFTESSISLGITVTKTGNNSYTLDHNGLSIDYPKNFTDTQKVKIDDSENKVVITNDAVPGTYKVVYTHEIDGIDVKVAETTFEVIDYNFTFSPTTVYNKDGGTKITCSQWNEEITAKAYSCPSFADNNNQITIPNNTAEGSYDITYTVWNDSGDDAKATYTKTFTVENTYSVTLNKTTLNRDTNRGVDDNYGTDYLTVTTLRNGLEDKGRTNDLKVLSGSQDVTSNFQITCNQSGDPAVDTNTYTLKASKNVGLGNYTLMFTGQSGTGKYYTDKLQFTVVK